MDTSEQSEVRTKNIPVLGDIDSKLREHGPFGLPLFVGVVNLGAGLGAAAIATGADPVKNAAIWLTIGVVFCCYAIWSRVVWN